MIDIMQTELAINNPIPQGSFHLMYFGGTSTHVVWLFAWMYPSGQSIHLSELSALLNVSPEHGIHSHVHSKVGLLYVPLLHVLPQEECGFW